MSLRLEMLQVARLAPKLLGDAAALVEAYLRDQFDDAGGAVDRAGKSDLYYTVFTLEGLLALQAEVPADRVTPYLQSFGDGAELDLVHVACLARCWAALPKGSLATEVASRIATNVERFRCPDGGYAAEVGSTKGTVYHSFLALGAYQDLGQSCPNTSGLAMCVKALRTADGGYANSADLPVGSTTVTAAAVTLLRHLDQPKPDGVGEWILGQFHKEGGFRAAPQAPLPDLLSTATALHALAGLQVDFAAIQEPCLDFVDTLWTGRAFCGHWAEQQPDSEYTYYGLLSLGHLSL